LLPIFREFAFDVAPILINGFAGLAQAVGDFALANERLKQLPFFERTFALKSGKTIKELADEFRAFQDTTDLTAENLIQASIAQGLLNKQQEQARQASLKQQVQYKKVSDTIDNFLNPLFGEQNSLLLTNIQLETDRNKLLKLITSANNDIAVAERNRNQAAKELQELQIQENVNDAQAAIRKAELQTKIALLTEAQEAGKDVALDLALAQAELAEAEFELANDSDRLKLAQDALTIAEDNLQTAIKNQELAIKKRNDELVNSIDLTNQQANANQKLIDQGALLAQFRAVEMAAGGGFTPTPETTPAPTVAPQTTVSAPTTGGQDINLTTQVVIDEETIATTFQKVNTRIQNQGKAFVVR
jgi:hypothetical protein